MNNVPLQLFKQEIVGPFALLSFLHNSILSQIITKTLRKTFLASINQPLLNK